MKAAIPVVVTGEPDITRFCAAVKQNLDEISGRTRSSAPIAPLSTTASTAEIIAKMNEIIARLQ